MKYFLMFVLPCFSMINNAFPSERNKNTFTQQFLDSAKASTGLVINSQSKLYGVLNNWTEKELNEEFKKENKSLIYKCHINCTTHAKALSPIFSTLKEKQCEITNYNIRIYMKKKKRKTWVAYVSYDGKQILYKDKCYHSETNLDAALLSRNSFFWY